jgi:hypothetical protein
MSTSCRLCEPAGPHCGNGVLEINEQCDQDAFGSATCESEGFYGGTLSCTSDCTLDTSQCSGTCGDGVIDAEASEQCDGTTLPPDAGCGSGVPGSVTCSPTCTLDTSGCGGCPVGQVGEVGCGRVFVWGDEYVTYDMYFPTVEPFWDRALQWLAARDASCGDPLNHVILASNRGTTQLSAFLQQKGFTVETRATTDLPASTDPPAIWVIVPGNNVIPADAISGLQTWVQAGGSVLMATVGWNQDAECTIENPILQPLGFAYSCASPNPVGPITSFVPGPLTTGLTPQIVPFVGGRWVVTLPGTQGQIVANILPTGGCPLQ